MRKRKILIFTKVEHTARRQIVHGIGHFAHQHKDWQPMIPWADLDDWALPKEIQFDGVIAFPQTRKEINFLEGLKLPVVCVGPHFPESPLPRIDWDDALAGCLAIQHLAELGLKQITFVGANHRLHYVARRLEGALSEGKKLGLDIDLLDLEPEGHVPENEAAITQRTMRWLRRRESPFGVVAATDLTGFELMNILKAAEVAMPEAAALVSIAGDNLLCPFCEPALSSVNLPGEEVGFEAARTLDRLISKEPIESVIYLPPRQVTPRRSSEMIATDDAIVGLALQFIRDHAEQPIRVNDVVDKVPLSRRPLELRFKKAVGRTLQKEIWRVRLERAKKMLIETDLSVADIAARCGFSEPQRMSEVFKRELNFAPGAYRKSQIQSNKKP